MMCMLLVMIAFADDAQRQVKHKCARQQYRAHNVERAALHLVLDVQIFGSRMRGHLPCLAASTMHAV